MSNPNPNVSTRFKPGQSGNPKGGNKRHDLTKALHAKMTNDRAAKIAEKVMLLAEAGEAWAIQMAWDRLEGKAVQRSEAGEPGDFESGLEGVETTKLKAALQRVT